MTKTNSLYEFPKRTDRLYDADDLTVNVGGGNAEQVELESQDTKSTNASNESTNSLKNQNIKQEVNSKSIQDALVKAQKGEKYWKDKYHADYKSANDNINKFESTDFDHQPKINDDGSDLKELKSIVKQQSELINQLMNNQKLNDNNIIRQDNINYINKILSDNKLGYELASNANENFVNKLMEYRDEPDVISAMIRAEEKKSLLPKQNVVVNQPVDKKPLMNNIGDLPQAVNVPPTSNVRKKINPKDVNVYAKGNAAEMNVTRSILNNIKNNSQ